ncbi:MAG: SDR family NAD(P)-dependent oxidoreductase [Rhodovarius sp.]|nr:SDR family NAD(P)-dependent oxidoreductase [Rhodovarius sp.]MDW8313823.1 SDR family NAD(P)-dependent oxidoreductase [Rhodovarius sp.]
MNIVITGASRGLGAALARHWAAPGVDLALIARDAEALQQTAAACQAKGASTRLATLDVRDAQAMAAQLLAWDAARPFDLVVANAGVTAGTRPDGSFEGPEAAARVIAVNLQGALNLVEPLLPRLTARRSGRVVLIASVAAFRGLPDSPAYCASKAGLWAYGESLRPLLALRGVGLTNVAPGFFASAMSDRFIARQPMKMSAEAAAARIAAAVARGAGRCIMPRRLGWLLRGLELLPAPLADRAVRLFRFHVAD